MASSILFTPLYGAASEGPMSYLLELDGCKILMDCGWTYSFDLELIEPLTRYIAEYSPSFVQYSVLETSPEALLLIFFVVLIVDFSAGLLSLQILTAACKISLRFLIFFHFTSPFQFVANETLFAELHVWSTPSSSATLILSTWEHYHMPFQN
jgi:hypothetical protein